MKCNTKIRLFKMYIQNIKNNVYIFYYNSRSSRCYFMHLHVNRWVIIAITINSILG